MKKYGFFFFPIIILAVIIGYKMMNWEQTKTTTKINHKLAAEGCIGLNYHRMCKPSLFNQVVSFITRTDELTEVPWLSSYYKYNR
ncbi:hypothetical protein [Niallia sp. 03133]|uniref:hypothetical protein n=1 Tax=Niallia sp. 03133 TaxID=3458060 RepID=UPI0040442E3D